MANQAQREAMRHIDAAKRVYKTLQPTPFPSNELTLKRCILELAGPSSERKHTLVKGLAQKQGEDCHAFCRRVLECCAQVGRVEPQDVLNVYKDGLLSGVREKIVLADHDNLNALTRAAQGAYETFKASTENTERLNALEAHIISVGGKVESVPSQVSAQVVEKLISVLQVNDGSH